MLIIECLMMIRLTRLVMRLLEPEVMKVRWLKRMMVSVVPRPPLAWLLSLGGRTLYDIKKVGVLAVI